MQTTHNSGKQGVDFFGLQTKRRIVMHHVPRLYDIFVL